MNPLQAPNTAALEARLKALPEAALELLEQRLQEQSSAPHARKVLTAYICPRELDQEAPDKAALTPFLRERLPEYMLPQHVIAVDEMPQLPNGKVDREALKKLTPVRAEVKSETPRVDSSELAAKLQKIWAIVLQADEIYPDDNFFEMGGDSLLSINVVSRARQEGIELKPSFLFDFPTIAELCAHLVEEAEYEAPSDAPETRLVSRNTEAGSQPFFMVHGTRRILTELRRALENEHPVHMLEAHWETGDIDRDVSVEELASQGVEDVFKVQSEGPYLLGGYSIGAVIAIEMARQIQEQGKEVSLLFMMDPPEKTAVYRSIEAAAGQVSEPASGDGEEAPAGLPGRQGRGERLRAGWNYYLRRIPENFNYWRSLVYRKFGISEPEHVLMAHRKMHVAKTYLAACARYDLRPLTVPLVVYRASGGYHKEDAEIWNTVAGAGFNLREFDCTHEDMQWDPETVRGWTDELAGQIKTFTPA